MTSTTSATSMIIVDRECPLPNLLVCYGGFAFPASVQAMAQEAERIREGA